MRRFKKPFFFFGFLLFFSLAVKGSKSLDQAIFRVDSTSKLSPDLNSAAIRSALQYRLFLHIVRPLVKYSEDGQIYGDLAQSWSTSSDSREFSFNLRNAKWSDGTPITPADVSVFLHYMMEKNVSTHFDFGSIKQVKVSADKIVVLLKVPNKGFIRQLAHPEFGVVKVKNGKLDFSSTSGPYHILSMNSNQCELIANKYYDFPTLHAPSKIVFSSSTIQHELKEFLDGKLDFIMPGPLLTKQAHDEIMKNPKVVSIDSKIGFSYFLTFNPKSAKIRSIEQRRWIQTVVDSSQWDLREKAPLWEAAKQLYLPDGLGRPTADELNKVWSSIRTSNKKPMDSVKILFSEDFPFIEAIEKQLKKENPSIHIEKVYYRDFSQVDSFLNDKSIDIFQFNNDFSALDISLNLLVAFNTHRPLILTGVFSEKYQTFLSKIVNSSDEQEIYRTVKTVGLDILQDGLIVPLVYNKHIYYGLKKWDFSKWSQIFSDIKIWKVKPAETQ